MKTKITVLALIIALFGFSAANAQGRGNGNNKGNKVNKTHNAKAKINKYKGNDRNAVYRDRDVDYRSRRSGVIYRERGDDRVYRRSGSVYYPGQNVRSLPPGQAKKIYGHQSAKAFAPGQQKKSYNNNVYYPQRRMIYDHPYDDNYRTNQTGEIARRIGSLFGL